MKILIYLFLDFKTVVGVVEGGAGGGIIIFVPSVPLIPGSDGIALKAGVGALVGKLNGVSIGFGSSFFFYFFYLFLSLFFLVLERDLDSYDD